jgi:hypothetical protein
VVQSEIKLCKAGQNKADQDILKLKRENANLNASLGKYKKALAGLVLPEKQFSSKKKLTRDQSLLIT